MNKFKTYPTVTVDLKNETLEIEAYNVAETRDYIIPMDLKNNEYDALVMKANLLNKDPEMTLKKIEELKKVKDEATMLKLDIEELIYKTSQFGIKRAKYPKESKLIGEELDKFEDIPIPLCKAMEIVAAMRNLANGNIPLVRDTKKAQPKNQRARGKTSKAGASA